MSIPRLSFRRKPESSSAHLFLSAELPLALPASGLLLALLRASCPSPLRGQLRCSRRSCGAVPKSRQKARHRTRCPAAHHARRGVPVLLGAGGVVWQHVRVLSADARTSCARPCGHFPPSPAMLGTANGAGIHEAVHPCTTSWNSSGELLLLRQDAAQTGPPVARRGCAGKVRRRAHTMCARSLNVHGRTSSEPRSSLAESEGRMPGDRATGGVFLWLPFFAQAKKVTRSPEASGSFVLQENSTAQEKVTRSPEASGSFVLQENSTAQEKVPRSPEASGSLALQENSSARSKWISACAEMTAWKKLTLARGSR